MKISADMNEKIEALRQSIAKVETHLKRIQRRLKGLEPLFPFTSEKMGTLTEEQEGECDIVIYRFAHVQDTLSAKVFSLFLEVIHEQPAGSDFVDKLNLLERLGIITDMYQWKDVRELRNHFSHDYTHDFAKQAEYLNELRDAIPVLTATFDRIKKRLEKSDEYN